MTLYKAIMGFAVLLLVVGIMMMVASLIPGPGPDGPKYAFLKLGGLLAIIGWGITRTVSPD